MSVQYGAISWNRQKKVYDLTLVSLLVLYLVIFVVGTWRNPSATAETLLIRALGTAAFLLLGWWRDRPWYRRRITIPVSMAIAAIALYWTVQRVVAGAG